MLEWIYKSMQKFMNLVKSHTQHIESDTTYISVKKNHLLSWFLTTDSSIAHKQVIVQ